MPILLGHVRDCLQEEAAEEVTDAEAGREVRRAQALHPFRRLIVEELDLGDLDKGVGHTHQGELREQDEDGQRDRLVLLENVVLVRNVETFLVSQASDDHDDYVEHEPDPHSLEQCDPSLVSCVLSDKPDEEAVVKDEAYQHEDGHERSEAGWRDLKIWTHAPVQRRALLDEECSHLSYHCARYERDNQHRKHLDHLLGLLDLRDRAQHPG